MGKARAIREPASAAVKRTNVGSSTAGLVAPPVVTSAYQRGLGLCCGAAMQLAEALPDIVMKMEHCRLRQRLGRCLISSVRHGRELDRLLGKSADKDDARLACGVAAMFQYGDPSSAHQHGERLFLIGAVRMAVASQQAILQHLCAIAGGAGRSDDLPTLHGMREECGVLDSRLQAAAQELAVSATSPLLSGVTSTLRIRPIEPTGAPRMQLKLVGRDAALAPSPAIRLHWRIADS